MKVEQELFIGGLSRSVFRRIRRVVLSIFELKTLMAVKRILTLKVLLSYYPIKKDEHRSKRCFTLAQNDFLEYSDSCCPH